MDSIKCINDTVVLDINRKGKAERVQLSERGVDIKFDKGEISSIGIQSFGLYINTDLAMVDLCKYNDQVVAIDWKIISTDTVLYRDTIKSINGGLSIYQNSNNKLVFIFPGYSIDVRYVKKKKNKSVIEVFISDTCANAWRRTSVSIYNKRSKTKYSIRCGTSRRFDVPWTYYDYNEKKIPAYDIMLETFFMSSRWNRKVSKIGYFDAMFVSRIGKRNENQKFNIYE